MIKDHKIRQKLIDLLPTNYRQIVAERAQCHPNTVYNVLQNQHDNKRVELEIFALAKETKDAQVHTDKQIAAIAKQL